MKCEILVQRRSLWVAGFLVLVGCGVNDPSPQPPATLTQAAWGCYQWVAVSEALATFPGASSEESKQDAIQRERFYQDLVALNILSMDEVNAALRDARVLMKRGAGNEGKVRVLMEELHRATDACEEELLRRRALIRRDA